MNIERAKAIPTNFNIDPKATLAVVCEKCQGEAFIEAIMLRRVSAILTGTGKEGFLPVQLFACAKCGHVNEEFIPSQFKSNIKI